MSILTLSHNHDLLQLMTVKIDILSHNYETKSCHTVIIMR